MFALSRLVCGVLCVACGGAQSGSDSCRAAGGHVGALYQQAYRVTNEMKAELARLLTARCDQDAWSAAAKECLLSLTPSDSIDRCAPTWTPVQTANLDATLKDYERKVRERAQ